ncbi:hypothetical protein JCM5350_000098 [Sporobolomyces pararoseus]
MKLPSRYLVIGPTQQRGKHRGKGSSNVKRSKQTLTLPEPLSLEGSISEEVLLRCLSFLTAHDLVTVARVSSAWHRLAQDPQLWRSLYLRTYASASTRRQAMNGVSINRSRPWKDLYKISTNWRNGTAKATTVLTNSVRKAVLAPAPTDMSLPGDFVDTPSSGVGSSIEETDTLLQVYRQYFFSAVRGQTSSDPSLDPPSITVSHTLPNGHSQVLATFSSYKLSKFYSSRPDFQPPLSITELRLDESTSFSSSTPFIIHLSVFYSTGQFSIFKITLPTTSSPFISKEVYTSLSLSSSSYSNHLTSATSHSPFEHVSLSKFHYPLLVTCSNSFTLRFYQLYYGDSSSDKETLQIRESETPFRSNERWAPVVLSLEKLSSSCSFKVSLAYSQPVFPNHWTVGLQEFNIKLSSSKPLEIKTLQAVSVTRSESPLSLISASSPTLYSSASPSSSSRNSSSIVERRRSRRESPITSIEYSRPFIVTSKTDNTIQVYRVSTTTTSPSTSRKNRNDNSEEVEKLEIRYVKTLFGHTARVGAISLIPSPSAVGGGGREEGEVGTKIVSAGDDGSFKVWSLDRVGTVQSRKRSREDEEDVIDIYATTTNNSEEEEETTTMELKTEWQRLKKRRVEKEEGTSSSLVRGEGDEGEERVRPERIKKILVDQDKIVVLGSSFSSRSSSKETGGERIRVLRFD